MTQDCPFPHPTLMDPQVLVTVPQLPSVGATGRVQQVPAVVHDCPGGQETVIVVQALVTGPHFPAFFNAEVSGGAQHLLPVPQTLGAGQGKTVVPQALVTGPHSCPAGSAFGTAQHWPTPSGVGPQFV